MTPDQLKAAAQVMLEAAKPGAIVEYASRGLVTPGWSVSHNPVWDWQLFDYRVTAIKHTTLDDLPPVCWVRMNGAAPCYLAYTVDPESRTVYFNGYSHDIDALAGLYWYSADRKTWTPFS